MMNADAKRNNVKRDEISQVKVATYGGLAGEALWLSSYPFDVVKSKMQSDGFGPNKKYASMRDCFAQTYLEGRGRQGVLEGDWTDAFEGNACQCWDFCCVSSLSILGVFTFMLTYSSVEMTMRAMK